METVRLAPCKRFETLSFSMRFQRNETVTIWNRVCVNAALYAIHKVRSI